MEKLKQELMIFGQIIWHNKLVVLLGLFVVIFGQYDYYFGNHVRQEQDLVRLTVQVAAHSYEKVGGRTDFIFLTKNYPAAFSVWSVPFAEMDESRFVALAERSQPLVISINKSEQANLSRAGKKIDVYEIQPDILSLERVMVAEQDNVKIGRIVSYVFAGLLVVYFFLLRIMIGRQ